MELKFNATIELEKADVERIIREAVLNQMQGYDVGKVSFEVGIDYGRMGRRSTPTFTGVKVSVSLKVPDVF